MHTFSFIRQSSPDVDVNMLVIKSSSVDADMMKVKVDYNMEAPKAILSELKMKLPSIISALKKFTDNYWSTRSVEELKNAAVKRLNEVYNAAIHYDIQMSELSIFFRNIIVEYQKTVQVFLEAVTKVLRETQFKLPGSNELTTLPEVLKRLTNGIAAMLDVAIEKIYVKMEVCYNWSVEKVRNVKVSMPFGNVITGNQILGEVKVAFRSFSEGVVDFVKNMESLDTMLVMIGENLRAVVEKSQEFVDSVKSDYLDAIVANINIRYREHITVIKNVVDRIAAFDMEQFKDTLDTLLNVFISVVDQFNNNVYGLLQQASEETHAYIKVNGGRLEIDIPFVI